MAPYHAVLIHFPIALWMTATLAILFRAFSDGALAKAVDRALVPLLTIGLISGVAAFAVGLMVWPWEAISSTPLGRNHVLLASWTVAYWTLLLITRWLRGEAVWQGASRWVMAGLALLGSLLLGITGTLGGHLVGIYTELSQVPASAWLGSFHNLLRAECHAGGDRGDHAAPHRTRAVGAPRR